MTLERRRIFAWCLFDCANSPYTTLVVTFVYSAYFAQKFAPDVVTGTALWSRGVAIAGIVVALLAPLLGAMADHSGRRLLQYRDAFRFIVARLLFNDGLITVFAFGGIYAAGTFGMTLAEVIQFWAPTRPWFWVAGMLIGVFAGPNQAASRSLMARFAPRGSENEFFGFFAFSGRLTAFAGPALLGLSTQIFQSQRAGVATILLFFQMGGGLLLGVDEQRGIKRASPAS